MYGSLDLIRSFGKCLTWRNRPESLIRLDSEFTGTILIVYYNCQCCEIEGNIIAARSGHDLNRALARQLAKLL